MLFRCTENPPENAIFPASGAAGSSRGVRLYGKQLKLLKKSLVLADRFLPG